MKIPFFSACALLSASLTASAFPAYDPNSFLIASGQTVYEYDRYGQIISTTDVPLSQDGGMVRDIQILENGRLAVFNGTFNPELSVYDGVYWESYQIEGWSTINNRTFGGIANVGDVVYLTDSKTYGAEARGLVAFDERMIISERFIDTADYIDITLGADNLLYALRDFYGKVDVFDPLSHELIRSVNLGHSSSSRSVTANANGDIFMASWSGYVARFDASGVLLSTLDIGGTLHDIDINNRGDLLVGSDNRKFYLMDDTLTYYEAFDAPDYQIFVAFATPVKFTPPPEPPVLSGSHYRHGRNIITTLNWTTQAEAVDVYFNGELLETLDGADTATYRFFKKLAQQFMVCNAGTEDCSEPYVAN